MWKTPLPYIVGFLFLIFTALHQEIDFLHPFHLELTTLTLALAFAIWQGKMQSFPLAKNALIVAIILMGVPLYSAMLHQQEALLLNDLEYRSWAKGLLFGMPLAVAFAPKARKKQLLNVLIIIFTICTFIFLYRYKILGEIRDYDARPTLHTKNGDPNFMCTLLVFMIPLLWYRFFQSKGFTFLIVLFIYCTFLTESRMGLVSLVVSHAYLFYHYRKDFPQLGKMWLLAPLLLLILLALDASVLGRFQTIEDASNHERIKTYINGAKLFLENPFFGAGWGNAPLTFFAHGGYPDFQREHTALQVHNTPLQILAELGIVGFLGFSLLIFLVIQTMRRGRKLNSGLFHASVASLISLGLNSMTLPLQNKDFLVALLFSLAVLNEPEFQRNSLPVDSRSAALTS